MLIILFVFALIRTLHGVPLSSPLESADPFTVLDPRDTQIHFGQRGVNDIIISCIAIIFACTWSAVHPNIPAVTDSAWICFKRRVRITIYAFFAPELMTLWAMEQRLSARKIMDMYNQEINDIAPDSEQDADWRYGSLFATFRRKFQAVFDAICGVFQESPLPPSLKEGEGPRWTLAHGFFLQMGGFMLCEGGRPIQTLIDSSREDSIEETRLIWNIQNEVIDPPRITEEEIKDRSKGDAISKTVVVLQTTWFIAQCIARWSARLPVTELEVITLGFAILNGVTYGLWWHKPQNVGCPLFLEWKKSEEGLNENSANTNIATNSVWNLEGKFNPLLRPDNPEKKSFLGRKLRQDMKQHAYSPKLLWRIPYRTLIAFLRPLRKMITDDTVSKMRVGMFYSALSDAIETAYATAAIGLLFGSVHLIPSWFLDFSSSQEKWLWRASAIIITIDPISLGFYNYFYSIDEEFIAMIFVIPTLIGFPLYPIARVILLTLSLSALRSLPSAALQTIEWTTFIPHL